VTRGAGPLNLQGQNDEDAPDGGIRRPLRRALANVNLGNRSPAAVLRAPLRPGHYRALVNMVRSYPRFAENLWRFLRAGGAYPYRCAVRTPLGVIAPTLYSSHDISTVNEVFCRLDYATGRELEVAVDVGANIGISALYFLTRNHTSRCYLFEADPRNVRRLRANLAAYEGRYVLEECAVALESGSVDFGVEDTGRYGGIGVETDRAIRVNARNVNDVLDGVLAHERAIDVLKIDVEGLEAELVAAIRPDVLARIERIYFESNEPAPLHLDRYEHHFELQTNRLVSRRPPRDSPGPSGGRSRPSVPGDAPATSAEDLRSRFPRVAITHEWLTVPGGSEKVVLALLDLFEDAELFTSVYDPEPWPERIAARAVHTSFLDRLPGARRMYPRLLPLMNAAFEAFDLADFDLVISSNHACAKNVVTRPDTLHVCYCHTPMRYAWEPDFLHDEAIGPLARTLLPPLISRLRRQDAAAAQRPDVFVANSRHVAARIAKYYRRDARVVHPPVEVAPLLGQARAAQDYYLVLGRVVPYKRADVAVAACERLGRPVKVAGDGRAMDAVRAVAGVHTELLGYVDDATVLELLRSARALLFPGEEDFGIVPVEAQAAGMPVIAYGVGGVRDSVVDGETGVLYDDPSVDGLCAAIRAFEAREFDEAAIRDNARGFSAERFRAEFAEIIDESLAERPRV
jgi:FkbM family methyltransferase